MNARSLLEAGRLDEAIDSLGADLRKDPTDLRRRTFLFELLCFAGDLTRAEKQLDVIARANHEAELGAWLYRSALHAERTRQEKFLAGAPPGEDPSPARVSGRLNGTPFTTIADADPRIGARLEVFAAGEYVWIPFEHVATVRVPPPAQLRDLLWAPATVQVGPGFEGVEFGEVLLPVVAPLSWRDDDPAIRLGRATDVRTPDGREVLVGQKVLLVDDEVVPILEVRSLEISPSRRSGELNVPTLLESSLLEPISETNPGGIDLRYAPTPVLRQIREALTEVDLPQPDGTREYRPADYRRVIELASDVLATQSKDLQVAGWLTEALARREGFAGMKAGLDLVRSLLESFWEHLHPEIDEDGDAGARAERLASLATQIERSVRMVPLNREGHHFLAYRESRSLGYEEALEGDSDRIAARDRQIAEGKLPPEEFDAAVQATPRPWYQSLVADLDAAAGSLEALARVADEKLGREAPSFTKLRDALREVRVSAAQLLAKKLETDPLPAAPVVAAAPPPAAESGTNGRHAETAATDAPATLRTRDDAAASLAAALRFVRRAAPTDPAPYLAIRGYRWGELRAGGRAVDPELFAAPSVESRVALKSLLLRGRWAELLETAEEIMATPQGRGWLDLQRYALSACDGLGAEYEAVGSAIRGALRTLLADLPELAGSTLMDDSPTANPETVAWLRGESLLPAAGPAAEPEESVRVPTARPDPFTQARLRVREGQGEKAMQLLLREAAQEESARARFLLRAQAAEIMVESGLESVAMPILRELVGQIEKHGLEEWETGQTVAQPLGLLFRCTRRLGGDADAAEELYLRVCRLDPMQGIRLAGSGESEDEDG